MHVILLGSTPSSRLFRRNYSGNRIGETYHLSVDRLFACAYFGYMSSPLGINESFWLASASHPFHIHYERQVWSGFVQSMNWVIIYFNWDRSHSSLLLAAWLAWPPTRCEEFRWWSSVRSEGNRLERRRTMLIRFGPNGFRVWRHHDDDAYRKTQT